MTKSPASVGLREKVTLGEFMRRRVSLTLVGRGAQMTPGTIRTQTHTEFDACQRDLGKRWSKGHPWKIVPIVGLGRMGIWTVESDSFVSAVKRRLQYYMSTNAFRTVMEIDTIGTFNMSRAAFECLKTSGDGRIVNITATLQLPATWYQVHASAAKAAVDSITRSLALEWGHFGIRVMGVAPGPIANTTGTAKLAGNMEIWTVGSDSFVSAVKRRFTQPTTACLCVAVVARFMTSASARWKNFTT
ncbi:unnamed protein product [Peronospora effusa]|nr:unnamed protein product [Peronospora effusa]